MSRGQLNEAAIEAARAIGIELDLGQLRLMPYIQFTMMNNQKIDPNKIKAEERAILSDWRKKGFIEGGAAGLSITKQFWDALNEIMWHTYVLRD